MVAVIEERLAAVRRRMAVAADRVDRDPGGVALVAVTKGHPPEVVERAYAAGQRRFGESRAQELTEKFEALPADIDWHFIGPLQRNKVRRVRTAVTLLHSLDRVELAEAWLKGPGRAPPVLLQVHLGGEATKQGFDESEVEAAVDRCEALGVTVRGLMTIPPPANDPDDARPWFRTLRRLRDVVRDAHPEVTELSMGMTGDFEAAIAEGATIIRVGSAIFGPRSR